MRCDAGLRRAALRLHFWSDVGQDRREGAHPAGKFGRLDSRRYLFRRDYGHDDEAGTEEHALAFETWCGLFLLSAAEIHLTASGSESPPLEFKSVWGGRVTMVHEMGNTADDESRAARCAVAISLPLPKWHRGTDHGEQASTYTDGI